MSINFITNFNELKPIEFNQNKPIVISDKNIKVTSAGYIQICKMIKGIYIRVSTNLKATQQNMELIKSEAKNYILRELEKKGYKIPQMQNKRMPDEFLHESFLYFLETLQGEVKETTYARYKIFLLKLKKEYPHLRTNKVDKLFLHNYAQRMHLKNNSRGSIKFKINTILRVVNYYNNHFNIPMLEKSGINIKKLGKGGKEKNIFTENELKQILDYAKNDKEFYNYLMIATHTGARVGEILALTCKDIKQDSILINKSKNQFNNVTTPKTRSSVRNVPYINNDFMQFMQKLKDSKQGELIDLNRSKLFNKWAKMLKALNLQQAPIYRLRHTFATLSISKTNNILAISQILGHANADITLQTYAINKSVKIENIDFNLTKGEAMQ